MYNSNLYSSRNLENYLKWFSIIMLLVPIVTYIYFHFFTDTEPSFHFIFIPRIIWFLGIMCLSLYFYKTSMRKEFEILLRQEENKSKNNIKN